jgi:hypothetical protein
MMPDTVTTQLNSLSNEPEIADIVKKTTNYDMFQFITANRDVYRNHVENIKKGFAQYGNLTEVQPILVNERMQIIDGQHRFIASMELGHPIYYTVVEGIGIAEARAMNILHASWTTDDYAASYAAQGSLNYQQYIQLREDYGFAHAITMSACTNTQKLNGEFGKFRRGEFVIPHIDETKVILSKLREVVDHAPTKTNRGSETALMKIMQSDNYDHRRMVNKMETWGANKFKRYVSVEDNLKMLEDLYNYKTANKVRLY